MKKLIIRQAIISYLGSLLGAEEFNTIYKSMRKRHDIYPTACKRTYRKYFQELINQRAVTSGADWQVREERPLKDEGRYYCLSERFLRNKDWMDGLMTDRHFQLNNGVAMFIAVRSLGVKNPDAPGGAELVDAWGEGHTHTPIALDYGGVYHPSAEMEGRLVAARFVFKVMVPNFGYDEYGQWQQAYTLCNVVGWNGIDADKGKGLADILAKVVTSGKEMSFRANIHTYQGKVFKKGKWTGEMEEKWQYVICPGSVIFGTDSNRQLTIEIENYIGIASFNSRPKHWCILNHPDFMSWREINQWRMAREYEKGSETYGYAKVAK